MYCIKKFDLSIVKVVFVLKKPEKIWNIYNMNKNNPQINYFSRVQCSQNKNLLKTRHQSWCAEICTFMLVMCIC